MRFKRRRQSELKIKDTQNYPINSKERCLTAVLCYTSCWDCVGMKFEIVGIDPNCLHLPTFHLLGFCWDDHSRPQNRWDFGGMTITNLKMGGINKKK